MILVPKFELAETLRLMNAVRPTTLMGVPTLFNALANAKATTRPGLQSLKFCVSGGAGLPLEVKRNFEALTSARLVEGYGLSETSPVVTANPVSGATREGSIGLPLPGTMLSIRSLEDPAREMPLGEKGEICVCGPQVMLGYWNKPQDTAEAFTTGAEGRYFRTGDIGHMDQEGYTFISDRLKDMINSSGFKVYPRRIEEALYQHPAVQEAVVIGIPDAYRGEAPKAFVMLRDGKTATPDELLGFLKPLLAKMELPEQIELRASLPKTLIGKLSKKELKAEEMAKRSKAA
jgi:long-chain acyl-CoA synthetase